MNKFYRSPPLISVVLCVKNGCPYITQAITSVINQNYKNFELILINDASSDGTLDLIREIQSKDDRVVLVNNDKSIGLTKSLNVGLKAAKGIFVARIDHDDLWLKDKLSRQLEAFELDDGILLVATAYEEEDLFGRWRRTPILPVCVSDKEIRQVLYRFNPFFHSSIMIRRSTLEQLGGYDESYRYAQDYELWTRVLKCGRAVTLPQVLCIRRMGDGNISLRKERAQRFNALRAKLAWCARNGASWRVVVPVLRDLMVIITPSWLKAAVRRQMHGNNHS